MTILRSFTVMLPLLVLMLAAGDANSAEPGRRPTTSRPEKIARARWQPIRPTSGVQRAQHAEPIPTPQPLPANIQGEVIYEDQGDVIYEEDGYSDQGYGSYGEIYGEPVACDSMGCGGGNSCDSIGGRCDGACGGACGGGLWRPCLTICTPRDGWFSAEYLLWQQDGMQLPPLITRGSARTVNPNLANGATIVFGDDEYLEQSFSGLRLNFGVWLDRCHEWSLAGDYFGWDEQSEGDVFRSNGINSFGRPFNNTAEAGAPERAQAIDFQGTNNQAVNVDITGSASARVRSQLQSGGFQLRRFLVANNGCGDTIFLNAPAAYRSRFDLGIGYRYTQLNEGLRIDENLVSTLPANDVINVFDDFDTRTQFNGLDLGMYYTRMRGVWTLDLTGRFAMGTNHQTVTIDGGTTIDGGAMMAGGLLALPSNMGERSRDRFSVLPELGGKIGYLITPRLKATLGYTFVYWSNVVRPGEQIDTQINANLIPRSGATATGTERPEFRFNETDYWAQGVSFGGEYRW